MSGINCQLIVCIIMVLVCFCKGRIHLDSYMWTVDKQRFLSPQLGNLLNHLLNRVMSA